MSKINAAESIRGLACMAVVFSHLVLTFVPYLHNTKSLPTSGNGLIDWVQSSPFGFLYSGTAAVYVFFVLSGYVLSYAILSKKDVPLKLKSMLAKRYPRLAIPALASCILTFLIFNIPIDYSHLAGDWFKRATDIDVSFAYAIYEGSIGSFIFGNPKLNTVLWTMQIELLGSFILFGFLYIYHLNKKLFIPISLLLPLPIYFLSLVFMLGLYSFIFGAYLYLYGKKLPIIISATMLIMGLYMAGIHDDSTSYALPVSLLKGWTYPLFNFGAGILIVSSILLNAKFSSLLDKSVLIKLGELSFSIYLIHMCFIYIIAVPIFNFLYNNYGNYFLSAGTASLIGILTTLFVSYFYSKFIDRMSINMANKLESYIVSHHD